VARLLCWHMVCWQVVVVAVGPPWTVRMLLLACMLQALRPGIPGQSGCISCPACAGKHGFRHTMIAVLQCKNICYRASVIPVLCLSYSVVCGCCGRVSLGRILHTTQVAFKVWRFKRDSQSEKPGTGCILCSNTCYYALRVHNLANKHLAYSAGMPLASRSLRSCYSVTVQLSYSRVYTCESAASVAERSDCVLSCS
jgi:hypothetical protein